MYVMIPEIAKIGGTQRTELSGVEGVKIIRFHLSSLSLSLLLLDLLCITLYTITKQQNVATCGYM